MSTLAVSTEAAGTACLLTVEGVLDTTTYLKLRDNIIKAALDEPRAVLVDVNDLGVTVSSAWSVFTSARWHVSTWPDVPVLLVCGHDRGRTAITRNGVARYVPVYPTVETALRGITDRSRQARRRAAGIYGAIITAAIIAAGSGLPTASLAVSVLVTLLVYWLAEGYAELLGEQSAGGKLPTWARIRGTLAATWPMVSSCYLPLVALLLARVAGASPLAAG